MSGEHPLDRVLLSAARARNIGVATPVLSFSNTLLQVSSARRTSYSACDGECEARGIESIRRMQMGRAGNLQNREQNDFEHARGTVL
jgi:hypothetical protein